MSRKNSAQKKLTTVPTDATLAARLAYDDAQLEPAKVAAASAAVDLLRLVAASRGATPPSSADLARAARATMSASGAYWQALVRASE